MLVLVVAGALALAGPAWAQVTLFTFTPTQPFTGELVTFTSSVGGSITWDLDGDGECNDAGGPVASYSFATSGIHTVEICVDGTATRDKEDVPVQNRPPVAGFTIAPAEPITRQAIVLSSTAVDPDGPIVAWAWDLDNDGVFDDAAGETAAFFATRAGSYPVALRVTDRDGATAVAQGPVVIAQRPPGQLIPAPVVRVVGDPTRVGARLSLVTVTAPAGAHVGVRCRGRNCPYKRKRVIAKGGRITLRAMQRSFRAGAIIEVRVTKPETIGKYTRLRIRAGERPARLDRCLEPGKPNKPIGCDLG